ncbi:MAG: HlyC/CorC family transporter [Desulfofustis sp.]|nr:HlyC/CorC family transporter [Desulfofustis sp.]
MPNDKSEDPPSPDVDKGSLLKRLRDLIPFGRTPDTTEALEHEIQELLEEGEEQGLISSMEERMISSIFDFRDTLANEIMTPAAEIVSFEVNTPIGEIIEAVIEEGYTRIPIYRESTDRIIGIIHAKDLLKLCAGETHCEGDIEAYLNQPHLISEDKAIVDLLKEFQKNKIHMSVVMDEFGAVRGLVTLEDILEEIVGEIDDEYDVDDDDFEKIDDSTMLVKARVDIEDVEQRLEIELPEGPYESIGGLIIHLLGRIGVEGDTVQVGDIRLIVHTAGRRRIKKVKIIRLDVYADD